MSWVLAPIVCDRVERRSILLAQCLVSHTSEDTSSRRKCLFARLAISIVVVLWFTWCTQIASSIKDRETSSIVTTKHTRPKPACNACNRAD